MREFRKGIQGDDENKSATIPPPADEEKKS
jgi:hypothetical protein